MIGNCNQVTEAGSGLSLDLTEARALHFSLGPMGLDIFTPLGLGFGTISAEELCVQKHARG